MVNSSSQITKPVPVCPFCEDNEYSIKYISSLNKFDLYFCNKCQLGFTYPIPINLNKYYHANYWNTSGFVGRVKDILFRVFQKRRVSWVNEYLKKGSILDVGSGEGIFAKNLSDGRYQVTCIDSPGSKIRNPDVIKVDFPKWKTNEKFNIVTFWESLEHTIKPQEYLKKAYKLLEIKGLIFIEYPRFMSLESRIFGRHWFHLDLPRHTSHLTDSGLKKLLKLNGFKIIKTYSVPAFEYSPWGFIASILNIFRVSPTDNLKQFHNPLIMFMLIPFVIVALICELFFLALNQSPIGFIVARKN